MEPFQNLPLSLLYYLQSQQVFNTELEYQIILKESNFVCENSTLDDQELLSNSSGTSNSSNCSLAPFPGNQSTPNTKNPGDQSIDKAKGNARMHIFMKSFRDKNK